jgi:hypothetical protein
MYLIKVFMMGLPLRFVFILDFPPECNLPFSFRQKQSLARARTRRMATAPTIAKIMRFGPPSLSSVITTSASGISSAQNSEIAQKNIFLIMEEFVGRIKNKLLFHSIL